MMAKAMFPIFLMPIARSVSVKFQITYIKAKLKKINQFLLLEQTIHD